MSSAAMAGRSFWKRNNSIFTAREIGFGGADGSALGPIHLSEENPCTQTLPQYHVLCADALLWRGTRIGVRTTHMRRHTIHLHAAHVEEGAASTLLAVLWISKGVRALRFHIPQLVIHFQMEDETMSKPIFPAPPATPNPPPVRKHECLTIRLDENTLNSLRISMQQCLETLSNIYFHGDTTFSWREGAPDFDDLDKSGVGSGAQFYLSYKNQFLVSDGHRVWVDTYCKRRRPCDDTCTSYWEMGGEDVKFWMPFPKPPHMKS